MRRKSENSLYPPLFLAKDAQETGRLLAEGADPDFCVNMGRTALCFARSPRQAEKTEQETMRKFIGKALDKDNRERRLHDIQPEEKECTQQDSSPIAKFMNLPY